VLLIAGSDSSGGAGIAMDTRIAWAAGAHAATVITAITAQDRSGLGWCGPVSAEGIAAQIRAARQLPIAAVKIGMLAGASTVRAVSTGLQGMDCPIVLDPVLTASAGGALLDGCGLKALVQLLCPRVTLATPNRAEAARLAQQVGLDPSDHGSLAHRLGCALLVTGGDTPGALVIDTLHGAGEARAWSRDRVPTTARGTGCALSTALAVELAYGHALIEATDRAITRVSTLLSQVTDLAEMRILSPPGR
jgi:hydroxymethylpyrimidine/phosphomethylpyrimidine kinase